MSGDSHNEQDSDLNNDDFVIDDLAANSENLDELFPTPALPAATTKKPTPRSTTAPDAADADDLLFRDHTQGLQASESFAGRAQFAEDAESSWAGEGLELEELGVPDADAEVLQLDAKVDQARASFVEELGNMLQSEEEFGLDGDQELELVGGVDENQPGEFEVSSMFVLDDGDGAWLADGETEETTAEGAASEADAAYAPTLAADETEVEAGWEPLPETNVDELAEVSEVNRTDEPEPVSADTLIPQVLDAADVDGHDIYADEEAGAPVLIGPAPGRRRFAGVFGALAAVFLLFLGVGTCIAQPEWFGLSFEPDRLQHASIDRPNVRIDVGEPAVPAAAAALLVAAGGGRDPQGPTVPVDPSPPPADPVAMPTPPGSSGTGEPTTAPTPPVPVVVLTPDGGPIDPAPPVDPVVVAGGTGESPVPAPGTTDPAPAWPLAQADPAGAGATTAPGGLIRIGEDLMLGQETSPPAREARALDGVIPGSRTFAQLHNGNYFVGNVKAVGADSITLRIDNGEVTLATAEIQKLTELGSRDYEELQRATSGFVRLTNNNRLVGGILSRIADDHVVLEFRSNRVMLPKSVVGEIVRGDNDAAIRLDTTREEENWLRRIAERQLGTGKGAPLEPEPDTPRRPGAGNPRR